MPSRPQVTSPDINSVGHTQWFYFAVTGMKPGVSYKFNVINLEKTGSQFNFGMQPCMFSTVDWESRGRGWYRAGANVRYFKNSHRRTDSRGASKGPRSHYYTASFSVTFENPDDTCFLAYHFPYTLSDHLAHVAKLERIAKPRKCMVRQLLCRTLAGNRCDLLTVTSFAKDDVDRYPLVDRQYVLITGRVHPGESNSSWIVRGLLDFLVGDSSEAATLRQRFVFKIIPMLNPDGVVNGSHRCSLSGCDLNRTWKSPSQLLHPPIFWTKSVLQFMKRENFQPVVTCDFHGHSRRKSIFMCVLYEP